MKKQQYLEELHQLIISMLSEAVDIGYTEIDIKEYKKNLIELYNKYHDAI